MAKYTGILGSLALIFAVTDLVHGQHNGDAHRFFIHIAEFISFFSFLCLLEVWGIPHNHQRIQRESVARCYISFTTNWYFEPDPFRPLWR